MSSSTNESNSPAVKSSESLEKKENTRQFVNFVFFKVDPAWRRLGETERNRGKEEFAKVTESFRKDVITLPYSLLGIRGDCDFMLWRIAYRLDSLQDMTKKLLLTGLGQYLSTPYSYLSMTKRSMYMDTLNPEHEESRTRIIPGKYRHIFVYPFVKTREWYQLPFEVRQKMMDEHIRVGNKYPTVKLNTTYSFGLDDQEFVLAFESDYPEDFLDLVQELRESKASSYTLRDTPTFTCVAADLRNLI